MIKKILAVLIAALTLLTVSCSKKEEVRDKKEKANDQVAYFLFEADTTENVTDEQMQIVKSVLRKRVDTAGYTEATVSVQGENRVRVEIPNVTDLESAKALLGKIGKLRFVDSTGAEILTGADFKKANVVSNQVELVLKSESVSKFAEATRIAAGKAEGENYIAIMLDEEVISTPRVGAEYASTGINTDKPVITGDFTPEEASNLANLINAGALPFGLNLIEYGVASK